MKKTILVVEDENDIRSFVKTYLESDGFRVLEAANGKEGLQALKGETPDLIVSDIMMPEMDGYEFFRELRSRPEWKKIPVIILTVKDEFNDIKYAYLMGVEEYVTKPFEPIVLSNRIKNILEKGAAS